MTVLGMWNGLKTASCRNPSEPPTLQGYFLDANLLVLLVVGSESRDIIPKRRRLEHYSPEDYDILLDRLREADRLFVTPNTLTEASNLIGQHREPERSRLMNRLQYLIHHSREIVVDSTTASSNPAFAKLGLADVALLEAVTSETPLLTVDFSLYLEAIKNGENRAVNFNPLRGL